ncbi:MFS transporter [Schaalia sp. ZJ405]|uniref:MFS transporter n=1 Tax=Schaalia sp. ZJ405 TaxID=2709403 RepID=UPI0013EA7B37|nr:MFS transporter [Schaalia sp. ZJ405]QPK81929.1 MFS transporter [Schaalia sp. ZJ405]
MTEKHEDDNTEPARAREIPPEGMRSHTPHPLREAVRPHLAPVFSTVTALIAVITVSPSMRAGATTIGPLLNIIRQHFGQGAIATGILTSLPCVVFAALGLSAVPLARRWGLTGVVAVGMTVSTIGLALRPFAPNFLTFVLLSVLALAGPAIGNVTLPAWIKFHEPGRAVMLITIFGSAMPLGGAIGSAVALPLAGADGEHWQFSLAVWAIVAAVGALLWLGLRRRSGVDFPLADSVAPGSRGANQSTASTRRAPERQSLPLKGEGKAASSSSPNLSIRQLIASPTALTLMVMFGLQSMNAYIQFGQMPTMLTILGIPGVEAGAMIASINVWAIVGGLVMPIIIEKTRHLQLIAVGFGVIVALGYLGLIVHPQAAWIWISMMGFGGFTFPLGIALIPARSREPHVTTQLSGMVQGGAYIIAAIGPILVGILLESGVSTVSVLWVLVVSALLMGAFGWRASASTYVDDEISR